MTLLLVVIGRESADTQCLPDVHVAAVSSSMPKRAEVRQKVEKVILPKIFKRIKTNRRNSTLSAVGRRNGRRFSVNHKQRFQSPGKFKRFRRVFWRLRFWLLPVLYHCHCFVCFVLFVSSGFCLLVWVFCLFIFCLFVCLFAFYSLVCLSICLIAIFYCPCGLLASLLDCLFVCLFVCPPQFSTIRVIIKASSYQTLQFYCEFWKLNLGISVRWNL